MSTFLPRELRIDISTACQLKCPTCPTANGSTRGTIGTRLMTLDAFKSILNGYPRARDVELSNWGEILLNPALPDMLRYARSRRIRLHADNGVNFNHAADEALEALVAHRMFSMKCSIDGATRKTYAIYRKGGDFDKVVDNIRRLNEVKQRRRSRLPILTWQFIVFSHNIHEVETARRMAHSLNMLFQVKMAWDDLYSDEPFNPAGRMDAARKIFGPAVTSREAYERKYGRPYLQRETCAQLWLSPQINWDGRLLGCCVNHWGDFGNARLEGLPAALNNPSMRHARNMLMGRAPPRPGIPCTTCDYYVRIAEKRAWMKTTYLWKRRLQYAASRLAGFHPLHLKALRMEIRAVLGRVVATAKLNIGRAAIVRRRAAE